MEVSGKYHGLSALSPSKILLQNQKCFRPDITTFRLSVYWTKEDSQCTYNVILRGDRVTTVAVEKEYLLHVLSV